MRRTLKHLAEELNVSAMTVSRALRGDKGVSETTRALIQEYARKVNYRPDLVARSLAVQRTHIFGIVIPDLGDAFWLDAVLGMERAARSAGHHVIVSHSSDDPGLERSEVETLVSRRVDAILIASCAPRYNARFLRDIEAGGVPVVPFDRHIEALPSEGAYADDLGGARQAVRHLVALGYRRIGHLEGDPRFSTTQDRLCGYREIVQEAGLPELITPAGFGEENGYQGMQRLLDSGGADAVFAAHDPAAIGALRAALDRGLRVPEDIALVGFGDIRCACHVAVPLTTVAQPRQELGEAAAALALKRIHGIEIQEQILLPTRLVVRRSCGAYLRAGDG